MENNYIMMCKNMIISLKFKISLRTFVNFQYTMTAQILQYVKNECECCCNSFVLAYWVLTEDEPCTVVTVVTKLTIMSTGDSTSAIYPPVRRKIQGLIRNKFRSEQKFQITAEKHSTVYFFKVKKKTIVNHYFIYVSLWHKILIIWNACLHS